jgi:integrase
MARKPTPTYPQVADYYLSQRAVSRHYERVVRNIAGGVGRLSVDRINEYLKEMLERRSTLTVRTHRSVLLSLWRHAYDRGLVKEAPRGVMRVKARRAPTRAWTQEQLRQLLEATAAYTGRRSWSGVDVGLWLRTWILLGYESGSRFGDLHSFRREHLDGNVLRWTQSKTGDPITRTLSAACVACCHQMLAASPDGRILGWVCSRRQAGRRFREFLDDCGIPGTSKFLRRSGATHIEIASPGKASLHLGHRTPTLAAQAYIDWGQVRQRAPQTPQLMEVTDGE